MSKYLILVGSYTNSVVSLEFDEATPTLSNVASLEVGHHPSWLAGHPKDKSLVVTGLEQADGKILTLQYDLKTGSGRVVSEVTSAGQDPCTLLVDGDAGEVIAGNVCVLFASKPLLYLIFDETVLLRIDARRFIVD